MAWTTAGSGPYRPRVADSVLDGLFPELSAIALEGAKGVGKTATARRRATTTFSLDDEGARQLVAADPARMLASVTPVLIDEWQHMPETWNLVRRAVDDGAPPGSFLLTGSATPMAGPTHSGAARIVRVRLRPMTLSERGLETPSVSLRALLAGARPDVSGTTNIGLADYADQICRSGLPGVMGLRDTARRAQLDGYLERIIDRDFSELGLTVRNPSGLRNWMIAYAAASSTSASYEAVRDAATAGWADKPAKSTVIAYREILERLWILEPLPAWLPTKSYLTRLVAAPKHHLVDPGFAARLLGADSDALVERARIGPEIARDTTLIGQLFESLATLSLRVFADAAEARIGHLRTRGGEREIDIIVERGDHRVLAAEVKLARVAQDNDVRHLRWLQERIGDDLLDAMILTTGSDAYRRSDGIAVVPLALLGP